MRVLFSITPDTEHHYRSGGSFYTENFKSCGIRCVDFECAEYEYHNLHFYNPGYSEESGYRYSIYFKLDGINQAEKLLRTALTYGYVDMTEYEVEIHSVLN